MVEGLGDKFLPLPLLPLHRIVHNIINMYLVTSYNCSLTVSSKAMEHLSFDDNAKMLVATSYTCIRERNS